LSLILVPLPRCLITLLNNLEDIITPINAGLASKPGKICSKNVNLDATIVTYHRPGNCNSGIPAVTLGELASRFSISGGEAVLKMDCQGCEFDVILNDYEHVKLFKELIFEYHPYAVNKPVNALLRTLQRDYQCETKGNRNRGVAHCIKRQAQ